MTLLNVREALAEMEADVLYVDLAAPPIADERFRGFWSRVNELGIKCMTPPPSSPPSAAEVREDLESLHLETIGTLFRFRPYIEKAIAAIETT
jgi:hypothetical protein